MSTLYIPANDQQSFANLEECMDSPPFIHREEQDTNAAVDRWSSFTQFGQRMLQEPVTQVCC